MAPLEVERGSTMASVSGIENVLEIEVRAGGIFRAIGHRSRAGRATAGAVYADLARAWCTGNVQILFRRDAHDQEPTPLEHLERWPTVGVAGARGAVGGVFLSILAYACLRLSASALTASPRVAAHPMALRTMLLPACPQPLKPVQESLRMAA